MRTLIIGTGWYGCQVACILEKLGVDFDMIDRNDSFFSESSSKNQNRLHFGGFHYCRSAATRSECKRGYSIFSQIYSDFCCEVDSYYIVARKSILDFGTYLSIYEHEKSPFQLRSLDHLRRRGVDVNSSFVDGDQIFLVNEKWIDFSRVRRHFSSRFKEKLLTPFCPTKLHVSEDHQRVYYDDRTYDLMFDTTYGKLIPFKDSVFEVCLTLIYKRLNDTEARSPAITVVDGDFFSLYPYDRKNSLYTLTHVKLTPLYKTTSSDAADRYIAEVSDNIISSRKDDIETDVSRSFVNFLNSHEYSTHFLSVKTKFVDVGCADRSMRVSINGNVVSLCGGKITGACEIEDHVIRAVELRL